MKNEPWMDEARRDLAVTARIMRRPRCARCENPIFGEEYLDLEEFGIQGYACERCVKRNTHDISRLEV